MSRSPTAIVDLESLRAAHAAGARLRYRFFWGHQARRDGALSDACFSQWWPCRFTVDSQEYVSAEQLMMAGKARLFGDEETGRAILTARAPAQIKALGRQVRGFDEARWQEARLALVTQGNVAKFGQDEALRAYLLASGNDVLAEASPTDRVWGIGLAADHEHATQPQRWRGLNLLGFALMRARAILRGDEDG